MLFPCMHDVRSWLQSWWPVAFGSFRIIFFRMISPPEDISSLVSGVLQAADGSVCLMLGQLVTNRCVTCSRPGSLSGGCLAHT